MDSFKRTKLLHSSLDGLRYLLDLSDQKIFDNYYTHWDLPFRFREVSHLSSEDLDKLLLNRTRKQGAPPRELMSPEHARELTMKLLFGSLTLIQREVSRMQADDSSSREIPV